METFTEIIQAILGGLNWLLGTYALVVLGILLLVFMLFGVLNMLKPRTGDDKKKRTEPKKAPEPHAQGPATHASGPHHSHGGGGHGHHDDHHSSPLWKTILNWSLAIGVAVIVGTFVWWLLVGMGFGQKPGLSHVERFNRYTEQTAARATPIAAVCTPVPVAWRDVTAPPNTAAKSAMIPIPDCHYLRFCDKTRDPECNAATFEGARFNVWCTTRTRDTELPLETSGDQAVNACRPQSKGSEPIKLEYAFIYSPPV